MWRYNVILLVFTGFVFSQSDFITFSHMLHIDDAEIECENCHEGIESARTLDTRYLPTMDVCSDCHEVDEDDNCGMCHANENDPLSYSDFQPTSGLNFSHKFHTNAFSDNCTDCHDYFPSEDSQSPPTAWKKGDCLACHSVNKPRSHAIGWLPVHGLGLANFSSEKCSTCHEETYCNNCHTNQQVEPRHHTNDYLLQHSVDARIGIKDCGTCHDVIGDCFTCHSQFKPMPVDHSLPTWVGKAKQDGGSHGTAALDYPMVCKSCHIQEKESTCLRCHS